MTVDELIAFFAKPAPVIDRGSFDPEDETWVNLVTQFRIDHDARREGRRACRLFPDDVAALVDANARCLAALSSLTAQ